MKWKIEMNKQLNALSVVIGTVIALAGASASAEQTIGVQSPAFVAPATAGPAAVATAKVQVSVVVQKVVVLRVGNADTTVSAVTFTVGPNPAITPPVASQSFTGTIPPAMSTTVATTSPTSLAGVLTVGAWTNASGGASLSCSLGGLTGATPFATGATASGVPGTTDITVTSVTGAANLQTPGATLTACGVSTSAIASLATLGGTFTYGTAFTAGSLVAGTYGNIVTYTATTL